MRCGTSCLGPTLPETKHIPPKKHRPKPKKKRKVITVVFLFHSNSSPFSTFVSGAKRLLLVFCGLLMKPATCPSKLSFLQDSASDLETPPAMLAAWAAVGSWWTHIPLEDTPGCFTKSLCFGSLSFFRGSLGKFGVSSQGYMGKIIDVCVVWHRWEYGFCWAVEGFLCFGAIDRWVAFTA